MIIDPSNLVSTAVESFAEEFQNFNLWNGISGWDTRPGFAMGSWADGGFSWSNDGDTWYIQPSDLNGEINPFLISNGILTISASWAKMVHVDQNAPNHYASGAITTYHQFSQTYGYFEIRAKIGAEPGTVPAFWLLPENGIWPPELDAMEIQGNKPNILITTVHSQIEGALQVGSAHYQTAALSDIADTTVAYHTYGVDWEVEKTTWFYDGKQIFQTDTPADMNGPMYIVANLQVGGSWAGTPAATQIFDSKYEIDYIRAYTASPAVVPISAIPPLPLEAIALGSGYGTISLSVSEDAYLGDAQFTVSVDGNQIGGTQTAYASHASGQSQVFNVMGNYAIGVHTVTIGFLNDAWGGSASSDRNLYVNSAVVGDTQAIAQCTLTNSGAKSFTFSILDALTDSTSLAPGSVDNLSIRVSEDAWHGDAQFLISIDGKQVGTVGTVTASHGAGISQEFVAGGNWGAGAHEISITFINDAWGGASSADRNLYVEQVSYNGRAAAGAPASFFVNGRETFSVPASTVFASTEVSIELSEDAYNGDAQYALAIDGQQVRTGEVSASRIMGQSQSVPIKSELSSGSHDLAISFLNDVYDGTTTADRNLYVGGVSVNGSQIQGFSIPLYFNQTQHFAFIV